MPPTRRKQEIADGIRYQIELLTHLMDEIEEEQLSSDARFSWRLRAIEEKLHQLRETSR